MDGDLQVRRAFELALSNMRSRGTQVESIDGHNEAGDVIWSVTVTRGPDAAAISAMLAAFLETERQQEKVTVATDRW